MDSTSKHIKGYIQYLAYDPFVTICFTEAQIRLLASACGDSQSVLCLDATGTGILRPIECKKKIFFYELILRTSKGEPTMPIADQQSQHAYNNTFADVGKRRSIKSKGR